MQKYRTYLQSPSHYKHFTNVKGSFINKPVGGLWGCRGTEWDDWCKAEEFRTHICYYEWQLKEGSTVFEVSCENDFLYLLKNFPQADEYGNAITSIDYLKMADAGYDAIELTEEGNRKLHLVRTGRYSEIKNMLAATVTSSPVYTSALICGFNGWDVPSICVFKPYDSVVILSDVIRLEVQE